MFKNPKLNTRGAQLLFTSHDMTTMKNTVFRRDEIWFAAENPNHESEIYSLYEIRREDNERVNSTAAFDKQYMEGRYGADPYLTNRLVRLAAHVSNGLKSRIRPGSGKDIAEGNG